MNDKSNLTIIAPLTTPLPPQSPEVKKTDRLTDIFLNIDFKNHSVNAIDTKCKLLSTFRDKMQDSMQISILNIENLEGGAAAKIPLLGALIKVIFSWYNKKQLNQAYTYFEDLNKTISVYNNKINEAQQFLIVANKAIKAFKGSDYTSLERIVSNSPANFKAWLLSLVVDDKTLLEHAIDLVDDKMLKCLAKGAPEEFKAALKMQNKEGKTPVFLAVCKRDNMEVVKFLAKFAPEEFKATMRMQDQDGNTPLIAVTNAGDNMTMLAFLIENSPSDAPEKINKEGHSIVTILKGVRPANFRIITDLFKTNVALQQHRKAHLDRIALSHAWHLKGTSSLIRADTKETLATVDLEGHYSQEWFHLMEKNLGAFKQRYPHLLKDSEIDLLKTMLHLGADAPTTKIDKINIIKRIQAGLPTVINAGYSGHAVTLFIWGDQFIICNRGGAMRRPIEVCHFNPNRFDLSTLEEIEEVAKNGTKSDYKDLLFNRLHTKLNIFRTNLDRLCEKACPLPEQDVGNCTFVSDTTAEFAFLLMKAVRGINQLDRPGCLEKVPDTLTKTPSAPLSAPALEEYQKRIDEAVSAFQICLSDMQISFLERNIRHLQMTNQIFEADHQLIVDALRKAHVLPLDPIGQQRLDDLTTTYIKSLNQKEAVERETDLMMWKTLSKQPLV